MTTKERERLESLCGQIAAEQNHDRFVKLVEELNDLLEHKEHLLEDPSSRNKKTHGCLGAELQ
jgi:hypothetical protein